MCAFACGTRDANEAVSLVEGSSHRRKDFEDPKTTPRGTRPQEEDVRAVIVDIDGTISRRLSGRISLEVSDAIE